MTAFVKMAAKFLCIIAVESHYCHAFPFFCLTSNNHSQKPTADASEAQHLSDVLELCVDGHLCWQPIRVEQRQVHPPKGRLLMTSCVSACNLASEHSKHAQRQNNEHAHASCPSCVACIMPFVCPTHRLTLPCTMKT